MQFLEALGRDASLSRMSPAEFAAAVDGLDADASVRQALQDRDAARLGDVMGGREKMWCILVTPDEAPEQEQQDDGDGDGEEPQGPSESIDQGRH
ncbi:MAG: hypothetical protein CVV17_00310 [Gammaproteobacteria bacterium HGW-Gammaproteobacteria-7]|nr:MAG: hypothetical protein CVV17_00310 [Gammaproteobacteria bacterium HGW-Gammaproteobacteria-7]